jgi:hypothetical protein
MRKLILLAILIPLVATSYAQRAYFVTGINFSTFTLNSTIPMSTPLQTGSGSNYEMGLSATIKPKKLSYSFGINLNEYNVMAGDYANSYTWNTKYLGVNNSLGYTAKLFGNLSMIFQGGLNLSSIVYGKQTINGAYFDLVKQKEFAGLAFTPHAHVALSVPLSVPFQEVGFLSVGYGIGESFFPMNLSEEKLSISTSQIRFGIHFNIN